MNDQVRDHNERRHFSRVNFNHDILLTNQDRQNFKGAFSDISLRGMLFQGHLLPRMGDVVQGELNLGDIQMEIRGKVVHSSASRGAAIQFQDIDLESFSHLRRLVSLNLGDSETIDQEFFSAL
ncbi:MAG: PilZ domain-containing protein [Magnetococcales bacterium]|nr:PilZ domain-containing protein [Magnetococcales bacterium]MBF0151325.1 PilZ domain-containing protein [Magnetococcales bacterium]MBF0174231.1 PilZ domain-containing protein [Magnetococcales bacterium]MBF0347262.1 PilZ domain-containing protein [Magnetococcales bacterium]MBF0632228.1 PilZ domain-containing protein [Magnetococcales bacterium]